jgi:hypothetical protein
MGRASPRGALRSQSRWTLKSHALRPIQALMGEDSHIPAAPAPQDVVEIVDPGSSTRLPATVESAGDGSYVLRFERATSVPGTAPVRWLDGDVAWQAVSQFERLDETSVNCQLAPPPEWERAPVRQSLRAPVDNYPMLVKIVESSVLAQGRRVHAICLDISASGCRASWPGATPQVGDVVELDWDGGDWHDESQPQGIPARVVRIIQRPFGARQVGFTFEIAEAMQAARVRTWYQAWLQEHRRRLTGDQPA